MTMCRSYVEQSHVSLMATLGLLLHGTQQKEYHPPCYSDAQAIPRIQFGPHELAYYLISMTPDPLPLFFLISSILFKTIK